MTGGRSGTARSAIPESAGDPEFDHGGRLGRHLSQKDTTMSQPDPEQDERPVLRIVRGNPDDTEIAALTVALAGAATARGVAPAPEGPASVWADRSEALRRPAGHRPLRPGPHTWRTSALPR
ncbi:acyl-CoA carboxylase subunit epsilon [Parasphingorhabdus pacifica]